MGVEELMMMVVEKLKAALLALENLGSEALAWVDRVFPPETRGDKIHHCLHVALPYLIAAVVLAVVVCFCRCCCGCCQGRSGGRVRMMKAPGRDCRMPRHVFESDPKGYFNNLRAHPGDLLC
ncbi:hypothetical protein Sango_0115400 [Sesamum angolense]|uniref:Uncharacterized protein n=1 Tax=Sesamum angolense TaxID=2727404 RepID=A0AAE1XET0_9LAMI|nr:hypothetical protein Sango_0115400 [Sesamum angolense]